MKITRFITPLKLGICLVVIGLIYSVAIAGIPPQDPPPHIQARYDRDVMIGEWLLYVGMACILVGVVIKIFRKILTSSRSHGG
ncbi:hypothetical protein [Pseudochryseolinea flava]|uniref:DUF3955 domain-containing protein n=1 Tax=Pseudochryseolinea flava TaxID=2059302 RepID=A0A364XXH2_9BACT|nr:hypothetical protein [Pseudochryseolinea flava]RAV98937.1 hypothetical protein DQQ10_21810 [Pseudochryseolinea flava]